jgi:biotin transporter BioY
MGEVIICGSKNNHPWKENISWLVYVKFVVKDRRRAIMSVMPIIKTGVAGCPTCRKFGQSLTVVVQPAFGYVPVASVQELL